MYFHVLLLFFISLFLLLCIFDAFVYTYTPRCFSFVSFLKVEEEAEEEEEEEEGGGVGRGRGTEKSIGYLFTVMDAQSSRTRQHRPPPPFWLASNKDTFEMILDTSTCPEILFGLLKIFEIDLRIRV